MMDWDLSFLDSVFRSLRVVVNTSLVKCLESSNSQFEKLPLKQKLKDLKSGDVVLPRFIKTEEDQARKVLQCVQEELHGETLPIKTISQDKYNFVTLHLDRPSVILNVLKEVHTKGVNYGRCSKGQGCALRLQPFMASGQSHIGLMTESPSLMRMFYIQAHVKRLLEACGYKVLCQERSKDAEVSSRSDDTSKIEKFISMAKALSAKHREDGVVNDREINLQSIIQEEMFCVGKDGLDKNLNKVEVFTPDGKMTDILKCAASFGGLDVGCSLESLVHIVPQSQVFRLQQTILLHRGVSQTKVKQSHLTMGPVVCNKDITMEQFQSSRFQQMKEASEMRHGIKCEGPEWKTRINELSQAGIKIEVLGTAMHCPLKLDALCNGSTAENRLGAFVLYNTARLATLLRLFHQGVENGSYPPMPSFDEVNFSLLREQEEWELVYLYVASFPNTVMEAVEDVFPDQGKLAAKIHTHRITSFLISFSKSLSSYYSRYHILGGPESHLLPLMFARLHLVQACHTVICNGLKLLDIEPLDEL